MEKNNYFTFNHKGEFGGHDMTEAEAIANAEIMNQRNPSEIWEVAQEGENND
jgi:hypothetical protein